MRREREPTPTNTPSISNDAVLGVASTASRISFGADGCASLVIGRGAVDPVGDGAARATGVCCVAWRSTTTIITSDSAKKTPATIFGDVTLEVGRRAACR